MNDEKEYRIAISTPELRAKDGGKIAVGYAAVFNSQADIGGMFKETIAPGAFAKSIADDDIRALFDHDGGRLLGRTSAGTLRLSEDETGLAVEIDLPDTSDGRDLEVLLERGDVSGMSFSFIATHDEWDETVEPPERTIHELILREVSAVGDPAYTDTNLALRSLEKARKKPSPKNAAQRVKRRLQQDHAERGIHPIPVLPGNPAQQEKA